MKLAKVINSVTLLGITSVLLWLLPITLVGARLHEASITVKLAFVFIAFIYSLLIVGGVTKLLIFIWDAKKTQ